MAPTTQVHEASLAAVVRKEKTCRQAVLLPHELVGCIYSKIFDTFVSLFLGAPGDLQSYWERNSELMEEHAELSGKFFDSVVPYRIYGDGADSKRNQHFELTSMLPCCASGSSTLDTRIVLSIRSTTGTSSESFQIVNRVLTWSFEAMRHLANKTKSSLVMAF